MKNILLLLGCFVAIQGRAQSAHASLSAFCTGAGAYGKDSNSLFAVRINPAALSNVKTTVVGVWAEQKWAMPGVNQFTGVVAFSSHSGSWALQADYLGFFGFNQSRIGFSYGRSLGEKMDVGTTFHASGLKIPGYVHTAAISFDAGLVFHFSKRVHGGISVQSPVQVSIRKHAETSSAVLFRTGLGYDVSEQFFLTAEMIKQTDAIAAFQIAASYRPIRELLLRTGINMQEALFFVGAGIEYRSMFLHLMITRHPQLGIAPSLALQFQRSGSRP